jgi:hypothetical protein
MRAAPKPRRGAGLLLAAVSLLGLACATRPPQTTPPPLLEASSSASAPVEAGRLLSATSLEPLPRARTASFLDLASPAALRLAFDTGNLDAAGYPAWRLAAKAVLREVQPIRIRFAARQPEGGLETQSGMIFLPKADPARQEALTWIVFVKGTELDGREVPSRGRGSELPFQATMAALGYAVWAPDYAGMGDAIGVQEYCVPESLAASGLDGLAAAREWLSRAVIEGRRPYAETGRLAILGYSEGGLAAMAVLKAATTGAIAAPGLRILAAYPMGAPLNLMSGLPFLTEAPVVFAYPDFQVLMVLGWARAYPRTIRLEDILLPRTIERVLPLFDGRTKGSALRREIAKATGRRPGEVRDIDLFRPDYLDGLRREPTGQAFFRAQDGARLDRWAPPAGIPVVLAASPKDEIVLFSNSEAAVLWAREHEPASEPSLLRLKSPDHTRGALEGLLYAMRDIDRREKEAALGLPPRG